jgi:PAS domain S-box-containing protein
LKFTPKGGSILVKLGRQDDFFTISIKDTGIGIPEDKLDFIFERFTQVDGSSSRKYEGTGIGLALTKEIVEIMGGKISVASQPGEGSEFRITLPLYMDADTDLSEEIESLQEAKSYIRDEFRVDRKNNVSKKTVYDQYEKIIYKKILIVEDSKDMQEYLISLLGNDYEIFTSANGLEGLEKAEKIKPDLILADIMMPEMDGYEMTRRLKLNEDLREIPILMLTAKADMEMKLEGFEKGALDYMIKPFHVNELKARIKAHLETKELRDRILMQKNELLEQKRVLQETMDKMRLTRHQLEESEKRFRETAEYLPMTLIEMDEKMQVTYLNQTGFELFKMSREEMKRGISFPDLLHVSERARFGRTFNMFLENPLANDANLDEYKFNAGNGKEIIGLFKASALYQENRVAGLRAIITEVRTYLDLALLPDDAFYGRYKISPRERDVFICILKGYKNKEIGEKLFISEAAVKKHTTNILRKTDVYNKRDLIKLVKEHKNPH